MDPESPRLPDTGPAALRALVALGLGLAVLFWPAVSLDAAVFVLAAFALVYGVVALVSAAGDRGRDRPVALLEGLAGLAVAATVVLRPDRASSLAAGIVAAWAVVVGAAQAMVAIRRRAAIADEGLQVVSGVATALFGVLLLLRTRVGGPALALLLAAVAVLLGLLFVSAAVEFRRWRAGAQSAG